MPGPATNRARRTSKRLRTLPQVVVKVGAKEIATAVKKQARADMGGDGKFSGMGPIKKGFNTSVRNRGREHPYSTVTPASYCTGVAAILEFGTRPHSIRARRRARGGQALRIGGQWITGPVVVRGSPAKHSWSNGTRAGVPSAIRAANEEFRKAVE